MKSSIIAIARNNAVAAAQHWGADYLFFLDSDMEFPPTTLLRLLVAQRDIVGATYARRVPPFSPIGSALNPQPEAPPPGLIAMERMPTGCLLIRMKVFERLPKPYFRFAIDRHGDIVGEDFQFCDDAREAGFGIWCDAALSQELVHIGERACRLSGDPFAAARATNDGGEAALSSVGAVPAGQDGGNVRPDMF